MIFNKFSDDLDRFEVLRNWRHEIDPDEALIVYMRLKNGRSIRDLMKYTTMMWKLNKRGSFLVPDGKLIDEVVFVNIYDWETKERIGTYDPEEIRKYW